MTPNFKVSNATSFPTEAQENAQKQVLGFFPSVLARETRCGLTSDQLWHKHTPSHNRDSRGAHPPRSFHDQWKRSIHEISWWHSRGATSSELHSPRRQPSFIGERASRLKCVLVQITQRKLCHGLKKSRWLLQWTILRRHDRCLGKFIRTSRGLMRRLPLH